LLGKVEKTEKGCYILIEEVFIDNKAEKNAKKANPEQSGGP